VHEDNLHIIPDPHKGYPEPDIPADDAWSQMQETLVKEMPQTPPSSPKGGKMKGGGSHFWSTAFVVAGTAGVIVWSVLHFTHKPDAGTNEKNKIAVTKDTIITEDKTNSEQTAQTKSDIVNKTSASVNSGKKPLTTANFTIAVNGSAQKPATISKVISTVKTGATGISRLASGASESLSARETSSDNGKDLTKNMFNRNEATKLPKTYQDESIPIKSQNIPGIDSAVNITSFASITAIENAANQAARENEAKSSDSKFADTTLIKKSSTSSSVTEQPAVLNNSGNIRTDSSQFTPDTKLIDDQLNQDTKPKSGNDFFLTNHFGLQWDEDVPFSGTNYYFTGYDGKKNLYLPLVPGAWFSHKAGRHEIMFTIDPLNQNFTGNILISSVTIKDSLSQDSLSVMKNKSSFLHKTYGFGAGIQYNFEIAPSLTVGLGINYHGQSKALQSDIITNKLTGALISDSLYGIKKSSDGWNYLKAGFISGKAEVAWRKKFFDVGAAITFPLTNLSSVPGLTIKPINGQVFFRWKIK